MGALGEKRRRTRQLIDYSPHSSHTKGATHAYAFHPEVPSLSSNIYIASNLYHQRPCNVLYGP